MKPTDLSPKETSPPLFIDLPSPHQQGTCVVLATWPNAMLVRTVRPPDERQDGEALFSLVFFDKGAYTFRLLTSSDKPSKLSVTMWMPAHRPPGREHRSTLLSALADVLGPNTMPLSRNEGLHPYEFGSLPLWIRPCDEMESARFQETVLASTIRDALLGGNEGARGAWSHQLDRVLGRELFGTCRQMNSSSRTCTLKSLFAWSRADEVKVHFDVQLHVNAHAEWSVTTVWWLQPIQEGDIRFEMGLLPKDKVEEVRVAGVKEGPVSALVAAGLLMGNDEVSIQAFLRQSVQEAPVPHIHPVLEAHLEPHRVLGLNPMQFDDVTFLSWVWACTEADRARQEGEP